MRKVILIYYTGTYNTRYLSGLLKEKLSDSDFDVTLYEINPRKTEVLDLSSYDIVGLGYPIYGFNAPYPFLRFIRKQKFIKNSRAFIYKNSGETYSANDASSVNVISKLHRCGTIIENEYHFMMPYNIHFRFDDTLVNEMLQMDDKLLDILVYEISHRIPNIKKYSIVNRVITAAVKLQFIGGDVNSFFYRVDSGKCCGCDLCIHSCPMQNIYRNQNGKISFHHHCLMCMRCSMYCPKDAFHIGFLEGWRVNGPYNFEKIKRMKPAKPIITGNTHGFFKCYVKTYRDIDNRYAELFGKS